MFNINKSLESDYKPTDKKSSTTVGSDMYLAFIIAILLSIKDFVLHLLSFIFKPKPENIANQLALVTGGGNGLGRELSMRFAKEGCNIAIADLDYKNAQKTAEEIREKFKVKCMAFQCDISDNSAVLKMKNEIESAMQPVDILVNNAGLLYMSEFVLSDVNDIERVVSVNLTSQIKMVRIFLPTMIERKRGRIVSVCSTTAFTPIPSTTVYSGTKWGLRGFMNCLNAELLLNNQDKFIKTTTVFPEFMNTRKELTDVLDKINFKLSRLNPERVADETVKGMLNNEQEVLICDVKIGVYITSYLSSSGIKHLLKSSAKLDKIFDSKQSK